MKKIYYTSPIVSLVSFFGFIFLEMLIGHLPVNPLLWNKYQIFATVVLIFFCFLAWIGLIITVHDTNITRRLFLFFVSTKNLSEVVNVKETSETDIYGTDKYTQVSFKDGDKWNLLMFNKKDLEEIKGILKKHVDQS